MLAYKALKAWELLESQLYVMLAGMNILVAVCGSIAAYKAYDVVRGLSKNGHRVRVVLSAGALEFVKPEVFRHLGAHAVYLPQDDHSGDSKLFEGLETQQVLHIALARWAQQMIVAPMTANTLNKLGAGLADDMLSCTFLALKPEVPKILFPAMNPAMWDNPIVKKNVHTLSQLEQTLVHNTGSGEMVCGEFGDGKLASVDEILTLSESWQQNSKAKKILITTGATQAPLDPIRFLTNASSGETGFVMALEALKQGFEVVVVAGKSAVHKLEWLSAHPRFRLERVSTTDQMRQAVLNHFSFCDVYISSAAIGDIQFAPSAHKLKKDDLKETLTIERSPDILKEVLSVRKAEQIIIGFAAETDLSVAMLERKWQGKPVDLLVGTKVSEREGFGDLSPHYILYRGAGAILFEGVLSKRELAQKILENINHDQTHRLHV